MKTFIIVTLLIIFFRLTGNTQNECGVFIGTDFSSECLLTEYDRQKPKPLEDETVCFHACKGELVHYYAEGMNNAVFEWDVQGSTNWEVLGNGDQIVVIWDEETQTGNIIVTATNTETEQTCTFNRCIEMIEKPVASITSYPEADWSGEDPVLNICLNQHVEFLDNSSGNTQVPITGYKWEWGGGAFQTQTTQNIDITFTNASIFVLYHSVVNECGCTDIIRFVVKVDSNPSLQVECYGTACANSIVTYRIIESCNDYVWEIIGGELLNFDELNKELTIQWNNPPTGYGIIQLDGSNCEGLCNDNVYVIVPIISNHIEITGPTEVCLGDIAIYQIPLYGATTYDWNVSGPGYQVFDYVTPNQVLVQFNGTGTFHVHANYLNEVLPDCGLNVAQPLTVHVKDTFSISGPLNACRYESVEFFTSVMDDFDWEILDENDNLVYSQQNTNSINYSFTTDGTYQVTAESENYCRKEKTYITINPSPDPVPVDSIFGEHFVCPNGSSVYTASPTESLYYTVWVCNCANPSTWSGEEYTANFGATVCDVGVYQVNRITGCISDTTWYSVNEFQPTVTGINVPLQSCANATFGVSVQTENNVLYQWSVSPATDASVVGDPFGEQNTIQVNDVDATNLTVIVTRSYCNNQDQLTGTVPIIPVTEPVIDFPDEICENAYLWLDVENPSALNGTFTWDVNGTTYTGLGINALIDFTGDFSISLTYNPVDCDPVTVIDNMYAVPAPNASISSFNSGGDIGLTVSVQDDDNGQFDYQWSTSVIDTTATIYVNSSGTYTCTVTNSNNCSSVVDIIVSGSEPGDTVTGTLVLTRQIEDVCGEYQWIASGYVASPVSWGVSSPGANTTVSGSDSEVMNAVFSHPGLYTISAESPDGTGNIYLGTDHIAIPCIPDFEAHMECDPANDQNILFSLNDLTAYLDNTTFINSYWTVDGTPQSGTISLATGNTYTIELIKQFSYTHPETSEVFAGTCTATQTINIPQRGQAAFSIENNPNFCVRTPVTFNDLSTGNIIRWEWEFSDEASLIGQNAQRTYNTPYYYTPSLTITDSYGCNSYAQQGINVVANGLSGTLEPDENGPFCSGSAWELEYGPVSSNVIFTWMPENITNNSNTHDVYQTGNYYVLLEDANHCLAQSNMLNMGFLNSPTASIHGLTSYCPNDRVFLTGDIGDDFYYIWALEHPNLSFSMFYDQATLEYNTVPANMAGQYINTLCVISNQGGTACFDMDTVITTLYEAGTEPDIDYGTNSCLTYGPVDMVSNSGEVYWSNGTVGTQTQYFNSGYINAYEIDPITGCKSKKIKKYIQPAPDYDGVITGCYKKCPDWFQQSIYAYLNPLPVEWIWYHDPYFGNNFYDIAHSTSTDAILPLPWFGNYHIKTKYGDNCFSNSSLLTIQEKLNCDTDSISYKPGMLECTVKDCYLLYSYTFEVYNHSSTSITVVSVSNPQTIIHSDNFPLNIAAGTTEDAEIVFITLNTNTENIVLQLEILQNSNTSYTMVNVPMDMLINPNNCFNDLCSASVLDFNLLYSNNTNIYEFSILFNSYMENISIISDAGTILDFQYDQYFGVITGLISISDTWVNNFCSDTSQVEFCFEITGCNSNEYCTATACINKNNFCGAKSKSLHLSNDYELLKQCKYHIHLLPNPAKDIIYIEGKDKEKIKEISIIDLKGTIQNSVTQDPVKINKLLPSTYFMRIKMKDGNVEYIKFIKE